MAIPAILASVGGQLGAAALKEVGGAAMGIGKTYVGNVAGQVGSVGLDKQKETFEYAQKMGLDPRALMDHVVTQERQKSDYENAEGMKGGAFRNRIGQDRDRADTINAMARDQLGYANQNAQQLANNYLQAAGQAKNFAAQIYGGRY